MGLSQSRLWHLRFDQSISIFFQKKYEEMETKLSMSVMQNLLATCWFYIINMCYTGIKTFVILLFICSIIHAFSFSFMFFPIERLILT